MREPAGIPARTAGDTKTRYPTPPASTMSASASISATTPSIVAITGRDRGTRPSAAGRGRYGGLRRRAHLAVAVGEADRDRERVGRVIGRRHLRQSEHGAHHALDLLLRGAAVAGHRDLHLVGGVLED